MNQQKKKWRREAEEKMRPKAWQIFVHFFPNSILHEFYCLSGKIFYFSNFYLALLVSFNIIFCLIVVGSDS